MTIIMEEVTFACLHNNFAIHSILMFCTQNCVGLNIVVGCTFKVN